jgi:hypothetical protein
MSIGDPTSIWYNVLLNEGHPMITYDLMIHLDEDEDPILEGETDLGKEFLTENFSFDPVVVNCCPEELIAHIPKHLEIGFKHGGQVKNLRQSPLH